MELVTKLTRLLLAEDHAAMLGQTVRLLEGEFEIVGQVGTGPEALTAAARLDPDVVILDISIPGLDGIETARCLRSAGSPAKVVFLTVHDDPDYVRAALDAGGTAYVVKSRLASDLVPAIHAALEGRNFVSSTLQLKDYR